MQADYCLYSDLDSYSASDYSQATIPPELVVMMARTDKVTHQDSDILLLEMMVPHNSKELIAEAHKGKTDIEYYCTLLGDLKALGLKPPF